MANNNSSFPFFDERTIQMVGNLFRVLAQPGNRGRNLQSALTSVLIEQAVNRGVEFATRLLSNGSETQRTTNPAIEFPSNGRQLGGDPSVGSRLLEIQASGSSSASTSERVKEDNLPYGGISVEEAELPTDGQCRPDRFRIGAEMLVLESGEIGIAKWTGRIGGIWFIGLEIKNRKTAFSTILSAYPELIDLFPCENNHPIMLVQPADVVVYNNDFPQYNDNENSLSQNYNSKPIVPDCFICSSAPSEFISIPCFHLCLCSHCFRQQQYANDNHLENKICPLCQGAYVFFSQAKE